MSDRVYVGQMVSDLDIGEKPTRISRVNILVDSEHQYTAGDNTGRTLEKTVPWGSQAMADAILAAVKNYDYQPFTGTDALLDPAAEIGDGITVGGVYSVLAQKDIAFGKLTTTGIAAPSTDEIEDEYPYMSRAQRQEQRKLAQTRSLITKTADEIRLAIEATDGRVSELSVTLDGVTIKDESGQTRIKGSSIDTNSIAANSIRADQVQLTGSITWADLSSDAQGKVNTAQSTASRAETAASNAQSAATRVSNTVAAWTYPGTTYINGYMLETDTVRASKLQGGTVQLLDSYGDTVGSIDIATTRTGNGIEISTSYGGIRLNSGGNFYVYADYGSLGIVSEGISNGGNIIPSTNGEYSCGTSRYKWSTVYANSGQIVTSDATKKHDIEELPDKYLDMFLYLTPKIYRLNDGTSGRLHVGFIAQEVEEAMKLCGIDSTEFGGFVKDKDENGNDLYMLRDNEFIPILWGKIQRLEKRLEELEAMKG